MFNNSQAPKTRLQSSGGGPPAGSRGEAPVGSGGEALRIQINANNLHKQYTIYTNNLQQLSNAFLRRFVAESVLHLLIPPTIPLKTKSTDLRESHEPTRPGGWVRAQPFPPVATLLLQSYRQTGAKQNLT